MPKVSSEHLDARRAQIVDAAVTCFARDGFHRTTMHDICREAALSPGAVYRYFASKEELLEALEQAAPSESTSAKKLLERMKSAGRLDSFKAELANRRALDLLAESATPISVEQAQARDKLWTPGADAGERSQQLWTPGS